MAPNHQEAQQKVKGKLHLVALNLWGEEWVMGFGLSVQTGEKKSQKRKENRGIFILNRSENSGEHIVFYQQFVVTDDYTQENLN